MTETATSVWAHLQSVTRAEWADAGQNGLQPQLVAVTPIVNYSGEQIVQIGSGENARRYAVYRTYLDPDNDSIELYLERKAGVARGAEIPLQELEIEIVKELKDYSDEVAEGIKKR